jgi:hypothetical protein
MSCADRRRYCTKVERQLNGYQAAAAVERRECTRANSKNRDRHSRSSGMTSPNLGNRPIGEHDVFRGSLGRTRENR